MRSIIKPALTVAAAVLLAASVAGLGSAQQPEKEKVVKKLAVSADLHGTFVGDAKAELAVRVDLLRKENNELVKVATVQSKANGDFLFPDVPPGEYVLTPDLATLPEGYGLYGRHLFVVADQHPLRLQFQLGRIHKLQITGGEQLTVMGDDPVTVETAAFDNQGEYLFAASSVEVPAEASVLARSENGARLKLGAEGRPITVRAKNGGHTAAVVVKRGD